MFGASVKLPPLRWRALARETVEAYIVCAVVRGDFFLGMEKIFHELDAPQSDFIRVFF